MAKNQEYLFSDLSAALAYLDAVENIRIISVADQMLLDSADVKVLRTEVARESISFIDSAGQSIINKAELIKTAFFDTQLTFENEALDCYTDQLNTYVSLENMLELLASMGIYYRPYLNLIWNTERPQEVCGQHLFPKVVMEKGEFKFRAYGVRT